MKPPDTAAATTAGRGMPPSRAMMVAAEVATPDGTTSPVTKHVSRMAMTKRSHGPWAASCSKIMPTRSTPHPLGDATRKSSPVARVRSGPRERIHTESSDASSWYTEPHGSRLISSAE